MSRRQRTVLAGLSLAAALTSAAAAAPDGDQGDFWLEVVSPHRVEVGGLKQQLREALTAIPAAWNTDQRASMVREALRIVRHARSLDPNDLELLYYQGAILDEGGQAAAAQRVLTEFTMRTSKHGLRVDALIRLGKIALRQRRPDHAIAPLRQAVAANADRRQVTIAAVYLASALDGAGRTGDAIDVLAQRAAGNPGTWENEDAGAWLALATLYDRDEQISNAFDMVMTAQNVLGPQYAERIEAGLNGVPPVPAPEIHYARAFLYETAGFLLEARAEWQSYVRMATAARYRDRARDHLAAIDAILAKRRATARPRRGGR